MANQTPSADYQKFFDSLKNDTPDRRPDKNKPTDTELQDAMSSFTKMVDLELGGELSHLLGGDNIRPPDIDQQIFEHDRNVANNLYQHISTNIKKIRECDAQLTYLKAMNNPQTLATELGIKDIKSATGKVTLNETREKLKGEIEQTANVEPDENTLKTLNGLKKKLTQCDLLMHAVAESENNTDEKKLARAKQIENISLTKTTALNNLYVSNIQKMFAGSRSLLECMSDSKNSNMIDVFTQLEKSNKELRNQWFQANNHFSLYKITPSSRWTNTNWSPKTRWFPKQASFIQQQKIRSKICMVSERHTKEKDDTYNVSTMFGGHPGFKTNDYMLSPKDIEDIVQQLADQGYDISLKSKFIGEDGSFKYVVDVKNNGPRFDKLAREKSEANKNKVQAEEKTDPRIDTSKHGNSDNASATLHQTQLDASTQVHNDPEDPRTGGNRPGLKP